MTVGSEALLAVLLVACGTDSPQDSPRTPRSPNVDAVGPADPDAPSRVEARRLRDRAYLYLAQEEWAKGIEALERAFHQVPSPGLLLNVAIAYRRWPGHCAEAYQALARFDDACGAQCEFRNDAAEQWAATDALCQATVRFVAPRPLSVAVDGKVRGRTPVSVRLRPGPHRVATSSTAAGALVEVEASKPQSVLLFPPDSGPPPVQRTRARDAVTFALSGLAAGAVVAGAVLTGFAVDAASDLSSGRNDALSTAELELLEDRRNRSRNAAIATWSVAAASGTAALVLYLTRPDSSREPRVALGPASVKIRF